jgi:hypothetical protein
LRLVEINFDRVKGLHYFGIGVAMIAFAAAGLARADAAELAPLTADELRQVEGRFSPLVVLSGLAGSLVTQGGQVAGSAIQTGGQAASVVVGKGVKTGAAAATGGAISLAQYVAMNQGSLSAQDAALAAGRGAVIGALPKSAGLVLR